MSGHLGLLLRTAARLQPAQLAWWPIRRLQRLSPVRPAPRPARFGPHWPALAGELLRLGPGEVPALLARAREVLAGRFEFAGEARTLGTPDWRRRHGSRLWSFHLQYHACLVDLAWATRLQSGEPWARRLEELVGSWLDSAGRRGTDAWEPYVIARRTANWIRALLVAGDDLAAGLRERMVGSLHAQLRMLDRRIEYHLLGNHLLADLHALALGGFCLDGGDALRWQRVRLPEYWQALLAQALPDGTHDERSPMYHAQVLADALMLVAISGAAGVRVPTEVLQRLNRMTDALLLLSRPDGSLHRLNDSAGQASPSRRETLALAQGVLSREVTEPVGAWALPDAGYWGVIRPDGTRLIVDAGLPGPPHQPGHAHCDLLSFELDVCGRPVIVDSGVSGYDGDPLREYARSTRAHNTVAVDGLEQSEVWGVFRMGRAAEPTGVTVRSDAGRWVLEGACRHYHDPQLTHRREVNLERERCTVVDRVEGGLGRTVTCWLHLHPTLRPRLVDGEWVLEGAGPRMRVKFHGVEGVSLVAGVPGPAAQGWYCEAFGSAVPATVFELVVQDYDGRRLSTILDWSGT